MNANQLGGVFGRHLINAVTRAAMAIGITKGIEYLARRGKDPAQMTDAERREAANLSKTSRQAIKRARQAARITRRMR